MGYFFSNIFYLNRPGLINIYKQKIISTYKSFILELEIYTYIYVYAI